MDQASFTDSNVGGVYGLSPAQEGMLLHTLRARRRRVFLAGGIEEADS